MFTIIKYQKKVLNVLLISNFDQKNYYSQVFLEKYKYDIKQKKIHECITDNVNISSDDCDREESNEENSDEKNFNKEN